MAEPLRHRQTKEAENRHARPTATAPHPDSTRSRLRSRVASWRYYEFTASLLPRRDHQLADRGAPGGFGLVHVLGDEGGVFEFAGGDGAHDVCEGEVPGAVFEVERGDKAVV